MFLAATSKNRPFVLFLVISKKAMERNDSVTYWKKWLVSLYFESPGSNLEYFPFKLNFSRLPSYGVVLQIFLSRGERSYICLYQFWMQYSCHIWIFLGRICVNDRRNSKKIKIFWDEITAVIWECMKIGRKAYRCPTTSVASENQSKVPQKFKL